MKNCLNCQIDFTPKDPRGKFCCHSCSAKYNNAGVRRTDEQRKKCSESLKRFYRENPDKIRRGKKQSEAVGKGTRKKYNSYCPESILELSSRTVAKIIKRLNVGCSRCGWKEASCDVHHINGRKIPDADNHTNLTILCPNCHRMFHCKKIDMSEIKTLEQHVGDSWKEVYYG